MKKIAFLALALSLASFGATAERLKEGHRAKARQHVVENPIPDYAWNNQVKEGVVIPEKGAVLYSFPSAYDMDAYRYTRINGQYVVIDPNSRSVVDILN